MKKSNLVVAVASGLFLAACIPSVNPFYSSKDVAFDQKLIGRWQDKEVKDNPAVWTFEAGDDKSYKLTVVEDGDKSGEFNAHLFKLKESQFLDIIPTDCKYATNSASIVEASMFPGHLLFKVVAIEPELKLATCDYDWLEKFLEKSPSALAHHIEDKRILLTASTSELQQFILAHQGETELFKEPGVMERKPAK
jgi:hypothetical protein